MGQVIHKTVPVQVWVDVDVGIAEIVRYLNTIPEVRTHASCQGTIGEGGPFPYPPYVSVSWDDDAALSRLQQEFDVEIEGDHWGFVHPKGTDPIGENKNWEEEAAKTAMHPTIVTLCGSTRFSAAFREANLRETLAGHIVLSIGCDMRSDTEIFDDMTDDEIAEVKRRLDDLHKRKIDLSDEILVLNVGGYVGESTRSEVRYALTSGKRVRWLEQGQVTA